MLEDLRYLGHEREADELEEYRRFLVQNDPARTALLSELDRLTNTGGWLPIETAPKDGTKILGTSGKWTAVCEWTIDPLYAPKGCFVWYNDGTGMGYGMYPTHWMPLPPYPTPKRGLSGEVG